MKIKLLILIVIISALYTNTKVQALGLPTTNQAPVLYVCDTNIESIASNCNGLSPQRLIQIAKLNLSEPSNPECDANPNDSTCGFNTISKNSEDFIIIYANTAKVEHWRVSKILSRYTIEPITPSNNLINLAINYGKLNEISIAFENKYSFKEQDDGRFINMFGESINELINGASINNLSSRNYYTSSVNNFNYGQSCQTALDFVNHSTCTAGISNFIRNIDKKHNDGDDWNFTINSISTGLSAQGLTIGAALQRTKFVISYKVNYNDGSILVIDITPDPKDPGSPIVILNQHKSKISDGLNFELYNQLSDGDNVRMSGREVQSLYATSYCQHHIVQIGREAEYLVTRNSDGDIISVQLIGNTPILDTRITCNTRGLN